MDDYIPRSAALDALCKTCPLKGVECLETEECAQFNHIKAIPAADVVERPRWIPVEERLPDNDRSVLVAYKFTAKAPVMVTITQRAWWSDRFSNNDKFYQRGVTHWQELPEPPKEEKHELIDIRT